MEEGNETHKRKDVEDNNNNKRYFELEKTEIL